jgi:hypothetical protein
MLYNLTSAAATYLTIKKPLSLGRAIMLTVVSIIASSLLAISGFFFPILVIALAFVRGYGIGFFEHAVVKVAKDSKNVSVDIGLLHAPMRLAEFSSVLAAAFVAQAIGFAPVFVATGAAFGVFAFTSLYALKSR